MRSPAVTPTALAALLCVASMVSAEIKITTRADGTIYVTNEGGPSRSYRATTVLRRVPTASMAASIDRHADRHRLDPKLVQSVIQVESAYDPYAVSRRGAAGLMQLMPDTAKLVGVSDPFDPEANIKGGTTYLRQMLDQFEQRIDLALAAYNAGPTAVRRFGGIPPYPETRTYVRRVLTLYNGRAPDLSSAAPLQGTRRIYMVRDEHGQLIVTTSPVSGG